VARIQITPKIDLDENELTERFVLAAGPGGQNVNKVSTAVELRFDVARSPSLPERVRDRLLVLGGHLLTQDGVLIINARSHRTQERNRADARARLAELIEKACEPPPPPRRKTRPTLASKKRRLETKSARGTIKKHRGRPGEE
jgi:ribosome-associated protein